MVTFASHGWGRVQHVCESTQKIMYKIMEIFKIAE